MQMRFELGIARQAAPQMTRVSAAVLGASAGGRPNPYLQPRPTATQATPNTSMAQQANAGQPTPSLLRAMMTPQWVPDDFRYNFYNKVSLPGQAFANMAAMTQHRIQPVGSDASSLGDIGPDLHRFEHLRDDWALRFHVGMGIGALATFVAGVYEHLEQSQNEEGSLYDRSEAKIQLIQKVGEFVGDNYLPEQVSGYMSHLMKTGDMSVAGNALVQDLLHRTHLDLVVTIPSMKQEYEVLEKIKKVPLHLDSLEHHMRQLASHSSMPQKLQEFKDRINADLMELEKTISALPNTEKAKEYRDLVTGFKESLSRHAETIHIFTRASDLQAEPHHVAVLPGQSSLPARTHRSSGVLSGDAMEHMRNVSQLFHTQFKALRLNAAVATSHFVADQERLSQLTQLQDSTPQEEAEREHPEEVQESLPELDDAQFMQHSMKAVMSTMHTPSKKEPELPKELPPMEEGAITLKNPC